MKMVDMYGAVLMDISSAERKGDDLAMRGLMYSNMQTTTYIKPEELWRGRILLSWSLICHLPIIFIKGWGRSNVEKKT